MNAETDPLLLEETVTSLLAAAPPTAGIDRTQFKTLSPDLSLTNNNSPPPPSDTRMKDGDDDGAINSGSNLFVTGIHPSMSEADITRMFEKYGEVENCSIMVDPHTKESRGFGFVKMVTSDQADAAREGLQGSEMQGRTLSIEKARRGKPRTPTPGKYFGPPKRGKHIYSYACVLLTTNRRPPRTSSRWWVS